MQATKNYSQKDGFWSQLLSFFVWIWSIKMLFLVQSFIFPCIRGKNKLNAANFRPNETYTQRLNLCPAANKAGLFSLSKFNKYITIRKYDWFECLGLVYTFLLLLLLLFELSRHKWLQSWRLGCEGKENEINDFKSFLKGKKKHWQLFLKVIFYFFSFTIKKLFNNRK